MIHPFDNLTDEQLITFLKEDSEAAFDEIYNRYWSKLYNHAYKRLEVRETTEELLQDLFTKLWVNRKKIVIKTTLATYLTTSIKYLVLNQLDKETVRRRFSINTAQVKTKYSNCTEETILILELENQLTTQLQKLPPKCKSVFELSRFENFSNKAIAQQLNISEKTVENQISKAVKLLKTGLKDSIISGLILFTILS